MGAICSSCGTEFDVFLLACPKCGSGDRKVNEHDVFKVEEFLKIKGKTPNPKGGKPLEEFQQKTKISGETKREALDKISKDRTQGETKVRHVVWELDDEGKWEKVHDHFKYDKK